MDKEAAGQRDFVERFALWLEQSGMPRMTGRVLGWLLVCEPEHQSATDLADALHASRGSISTTTRTLAQAGLVERITFPGDRRTYYRARANWNSLLEAQLKQVGELRGLVEAALEDASAGQERLAHIHDFATFWESLLTQAIAGRDAG
jgi:DNA-binding transcriptional regulator GbsR (MarR family)